MIRKKLAEIYLKKLKELFPKIKTPLKYETPFQFLVAVILSAQTTDKQVNKVTSRLFNQSKTSYDFMKIKREELERQIKSIGLYKTKADYILSSAKIISEKYHGKVPFVFKDLLSLPGVGRKTANVVLSEISGKN